MLRFAEELLLLLLNEDAGDLAFVPESALRHTLAGASWPPGPQGRPIKPLLAVQEIIADQTGEIMAGEPVSEYLEDMVAFLEILLTTKVAKQLPMFPFARKFRKARRRLEQLARKSLQLHRPGAALHNRKDLISDLLDLHEADPQFMPEIDKPMPSSPLAWAPIAAWATAWRKRKRC